uniref:NADH dehydrogenase subunit 2 n=1 Tax=Postharmostomum commutatum TaxID=2336775 RepID=A0A5C1D5R4_9TREM|nr:NADH dehydrogenase subunit 2 [Postharmostomum commutatum]QEL51324.1 NADH dehydrogenase subunit 2 [Postharmostomum commutatum]
MGNLLFGYLSSVGCVASVVFFSISVFYSEDLLYFWLFIELGGLSLIPCLYVELRGSLRPWREHKLASAALSYVIVLSIASSLLLAGIIVNELIFFLLLGFIIKFGVYPFSGWVINVFCSSKSLPVILCMSVFLKFPLLCMSYILSLTSLQGLNGVSPVLSLLCGATFVYMTIKFFTSVVNLYECWACMMISSSAALLYLSVIVPMSMLVSLFVVYSGWAFLVVASLFWFNLSLTLSEGVSRRWFIFMYSVVYLATPLSLVLFYKFFISWCMLSGSSLVLFSWCVNSIAEQWWLMRYLVGVYAAGKRSWNGGGMV